MSIESIAFDRESSTMAPRTQSGNRFGIRFVKWALLGTALYLVGTSFWTAEVGAQYKAKQVALDHRFHEAAEKLEATFKNPAATPAEREAADRELKDISATIHEESHSGFSGTDAIVASVLALPVLWCAAFLPAFLIHRSRSRLEVSNLDPAVNSKREAA